MKRKFQSEYSKIYVEDQGTSYPPRSKKNRNSGEICPICEMLLSSKIHQQNPCE